MRLILVAALAASVLTGCYLTRQGYRQVELLMSREPIERVLKNDQLVPQERQKLIFTNDVLNFAKTAGLNIGSSYSNYVRLDGDAVSYVVQAAKPTEMDLKTWWFPIVGSVPYLGFFDRRDREKEAGELERQGFEVHRGSVAAYSSLGWFSDPVFSSMLRRSDVELAHLYFHELTHRTVWLKDGVEFNENLAEFVADVLTNEFFTIKNRRRELDELKVAQKDYQLFKVWLQQLRKSLGDNLAASKGAPESERVQRKNEVISLAISKKPAFKRVDFVGSGSWNNARILAASLYSPDTAAFERSAACYTDKSSPAWIGNFLKTLKKLAETHDDGFSALKAICQGT
jgi:predicted aminopeptidase